MGDIRRQRLSLAAVILAAACGQNPDLVTARLVDPRESQGWPGVRMYLVAVHQTPMAPFPGMDRLWHRLRHERVDTVPGVRAVGTVTVVGDNSVTGFHGEADGGATVFQYDAFSHTLRQLPLPSWFHDAVLNPPPEFAPGGRHVMFLARTPAGMMRAEVHSWPDGAPVVVGLPVRPNPGASDPPRISWGNATDFYVSLPTVSDTGPIWLLSKGRVTGASGQIDSATRYRDVKRTSAPIPTQPPSTFGDLPRAFRGELASRGCSVPQSDSGSNVIHGHFGDGSQIDWAVLCSDRVQSAIFVYWGGPAQCPREIQRAPDDQYSAVYPTHTEFLRSIYVTDGYQVHGPRGRPGTDRTVKLAHDAIEDSKHNAGSTVWFCEGGKWTHYTGAYRR